MAGRFLRRAAVRAVQGLLRARHIVAIKGVGGCHLVCDATSDRAVGLLRGRTQRVGKRLVVMRTAVGGTRVIPMPLGEQLPRVC